MDTLKVARLSLRVAVEAEEEVVAVNKKHIIVSLIGLLILSLAGPRMLRRERNPAEESETGGNGTKAVATPPGNSRFKVKSRENPTRSTDSIDPILVIEDFDVRFKDIRREKGEAWTVGLQELASMSNRLQKGGDYKSACASALMVIRIADLSIFRLMEGEVTPRDTSRGISQLAYRLPNDQKLIDYICEFNPDATAIRKENPLESASDFVSRIEPEVIIPNIGWYHDKTATEVIREPSANAILFVIGAADLRLRAAKITSSYLKKGGDPHLTGSELESDLTLRTGKEIANLPKPLLGDSKPTSATIAFFIEHARERYHENVPEPH